MESFKPTCNREFWVKRQILTKKIRHFFEERKVLEVETPVLSKGCGTDPQLDYFEVDDKYYLMTSPEFHMKRLLASNYGDIYQITKAFRKDEFGSHHNFEFSILEWYRIGMPMEDLMGEVENLVSVILDKKIIAKRTRWIDAFIDYGQINPMTAGIQDFVEVCKKNKIPVPEKSESLSREDWWDYIMVFIIEPALSKGGPEFIYDYPKSQAALAKTYTDNEGYSWAMRFELFVNQIELCNGYCELTDFKEQKRRFEEDIEIRKRNNKKIPKIDENFLEGIKAGLPECSGVALGLDRLFMLALKQEEIKDVMLFPSPIA